jgi:hypothetical protein
VWALLRKSYLWKFETNIPRKGIARAQSQFPQSCVCERFLYSQDWSTYFLQQNRQIDCGNTVYNSLTDTQMWKLWLWPRNSFSGNNSFEFSVLVLCSELQFSISILLAVFGHSRGIVQKMHNSKTVPLKRTDRVLHNRCKSWGGGGGNRGVAH